MTKTRRKSTPEGAFASGYMIYPRFLVKLDLSETAKLVYLFLLDRARLSQKNGCVDEDGNIFVLYSTNNLSADCGRSTRCIGDALRELEDAKLIFRENLRSKRRKIYVNMCEDFFLSTRQNTVQNIYDKLPTSKNNINKNIKQYSFEDGESL